MAHGDRLHVHRRDRPRAAICQDAVERACDQDGRIRVRYRSRRFDAQRLGDAPQDLRQDAAHHLAGGDVGAYCVHHLGRHERHVERRGDDGALKPARNVLRDLHAGAHLSLVGGSTQVGRQEHVVELV